MSPGTILLVGAMLTLLVGAFGVQARRRERYAQALVARRLAEREQAEQALARAEERLRTAFAEAPIGMAVVSAEGRFLQVNRALAQITGYGEQELLALPCAGELTHPEDRRADERAGAGMRTGALRAYDAEKRYLHAAGHTVWVAVHTTLIRDERGEPADFLSQIEDITDRRRYESELQHMADHDPLTGLLNRRAYERSLEEHLHAWRALRPRGRGAGAGPGQLQGGQRHPRPQRRRRADRARRGRSGGAPARERHARAPRGATSSRS